MKPLRPIDKDAVHCCATCDTEVGEEAWCEGCIAFLCQSCNQTEPVGDHEPGDHQMWNQGYE